LIRYSPPESEDCQKLKATLEKIEAVVSVINNRNKDIEAMRKIMEIQNLFAGQKEVSLPSPTRKLLMNEVVKETKNAQLKEAHYYLFNDLLLRAKPKKLGDGLICKTQIPVEFLLVKEVEESRIFTHYITDIFGARWRPRYTTLV
jgi:hypothetical protein